MPTEPTVTVRSIPQGYAFVPKGNVFITGNCRKSTQAAHQKVYLVVSPGSDKKPLGIAVPEVIHDDVRARETETRDQRAAAVDKRDAGIKTEFEKAVQEEYPRIPADALSQVLKTALEKRKGKVGRTGTLDIELKARLAVRAHIRHCHTLYEAHLRGRTMTKGEARDAVTEEVAKVARAWGKAPGVWSKPKRGQGTAKAKAAKAKTKAPAQAKDLDTVVTIAKRPLPKPHDSAVEKTTGSPDATKANKAIADKPRKKKDRTKAARKAAKREKHRQKIAPQPRCTTRSMQSIQQSIQELALRLPDDADHLVRRIR